MGSGSVFLTEDVGRGTTAKTVPTWDGRSETLRCHFKETRWATMGIKASEGKYAVAKLLLVIGPAVQQAAVKWKPLESQEDDRAERWLRKLATLPAMQLAAPKATAMVERYFWPAMASFETVASTWSGTIMPRSLASWGGTRTSPNTRRCLPTDRPAGGAHQLGP